jgi:hypothetical protein
MIRGLIDAWRAVRWYRKGREVYAAVLIHRDGRREILSMPGEHPRHTLVMPDGEGFYVSETTGPRKSPLSVKRFSLIKQDSSLGVCLYEEEDNIPEISI